MRKLARGLTLIICILFIRQAVLAQSTAFAVDASPKRYISVPTPSGSSLRLFDDWTLEALVYVPVGAGTSEIHIIESYGASIMDGGYILRLTGKKVKAYSVGPTGYHQIVGNTQVNEGEWNHVAATFNESTGKLTVYLNGKEDGSSTASSPLQTYNNPNLYIGARGDDQNINHDVELDEVRIWNIERSESAIRSTVNLPLNGTETGLVGYYDFENINTSTNPVYVDDKSTNGNTGEIINFAPSTLISNNFNSLITTCVQYGKEFNPDKTLRALVVFVRFTGDDGLSVPGWDSDPNGFPDYVNPSTMDFDELLFRRTSQFNTVGANYFNISNFYNLMSKPEKDFKLIGDHFTNASGQPLTIEIDPSGAGSFSTLNSRAVTEMGIQNPAYKLGDPAFDLGHFDNRKSNPSYTSPPFVHIPDGAADFVIFVYRYDRSWGTGGTFGNVHGMGGSGGGVVAAGPYPYNNGFTIGAGGGIPHETFVHELAHINYDYPHIGTVNGVVGNYFYGQEAYGSTKPQFFFEVNAHERWKMGYIDIQNRDVSVTNPPNPSGYLLRDYLNTGDALRVEIPFSGGQHLWIENHKKENTLFDEHVWKGRELKLPHPPGLPGMRAGGYMYVEAMNSNDPCDLIYFSTGNSLKMIFPGGQHDYTYGSYTGATTGWGHPLHDITRGDENPLSGRSPWVRPREDFNNNGTITYGTNANQASNEGVEDDHFHCREDVNAGTATPGTNFQSLYRNFGVSDPSFETGGTNNDYDRPSAFLPGDVIDMSSNPAITNYPSYNFADRKLNTTYLNGLKVEFADGALYGGNTGDLQVFISYNEITVDNDVRWAGNDIELPNITGTNADDLFLTNNSTITINKSGTNNTQYELTPGGRDYIRPTNFTIGSNAKMHLAANTIVHVKDNSTFIVDANAELVLEDGAQLIIDEDAILYLKGNNITLNGPDARIVVHGTIASDAGVDFTFDGTGYVQFHPTNQLALGSGARFHIQGPSQGHRMMELVENTTVDVDGNSMTLYTGKVIYEDNTRLKAHNNQVFVNYVDFEGPGKYSNTYALEVYDNTMPFFFFRYNNLYDLGAGLYCSNPTGNNLYTNIIDNSFEDMGVGIYNSDLNSLTTSQNSFDGVDYGVYIVDNAGYYASNDDEFANGWNAVYVEDADFVTLNGSVISTFNDGVYAENTTIYMRQQATISDCNFGINSVNASTPTPADDIIIGDHSCAYIINNGTGIKGNDIILQVDATTHAANRGSLFVTPNRFDGNNLIFDVCYHNSSSITSINARENDYGTAFTPVLYNLDRKNTSGTCYHPITLVHSHLDADASNCEEPPLSIVEPILEDESAEGEIGLGLEAINADRVKLYPNPTTGTIQLDLRQTVSNVTVKITNALGQEVSAAHYEQLQQAALELQGPAGLYFVHLIIEDQEQATLKVVKK